MMPFGFFFFPFWGAGLPGCSVGPGLYAATNQIPKSFIGQAAVDQRQGSGRPEALTNWWHEFHDPLMTSFVERALDRNLDLQQALARVTQARAALKSATAALLPSGQVTGQAAEQELSFRTPIVKSHRPYPASSKPIRFTSWISAQVGNLICSAV